jgi:hypothetical protein
MRNTLDTAEKSKELKIKKLKLTGMDIPKNRANFSTSISTNGTAYIMGGNSSDLEFQDFYQLDLKTLKWERLPYSINGPLAGQASTFLPGKDLSSGGLLIYGGWNIDKCNDSLHLVELDCLNFQECQKYKKEESLSKSTKTMSDMRQKIENDQNKPYGRRGHSLTFCLDWSLVMMIGGWNSLEWSPKLVNLDVWGLGPGK